MEVVFERGVYQVDTKYGKATVVVTDDVRLCQIESDLVALASKQSERGCNGI